MKIGIALSEQERLLGKGRFSGKEVCLGKGGYWDVVEKCEQYLEKNSCWKKDNYISSRFKVGA
ncbi:hypothetical protein C2G38_2190428 [Gigaspora rosea]|uniref:Uncharacterized protein n=1 Tax=Gigaspora rosea TaxID=44941 RepID=A0A397V2N1_9GLOM|nr:hypothetical protein C2G38_2190428 [Gigaspora rosea]